MREEQGIACSCMPPIRGTMPVIVGNLPLPRWRGHLSLVSTMDILETCLAPQEGGFEVAKWQIGGRWASIPALRSEGPHADSGF